MPTWAPNDDYKMEKDIKVIAENATGKNKKKEKEVNNMKRSQINEYMLFLLMLVLWLTDTQTGVDDEQT